MEEPKHVQECTRRIERANDFFLKLTQLNVFTSGNDVEQAEALKALAFFCFLEHSGRYNSVFIDNKILALTARYYPPSGLNKYSSQQGITLYIAYEFNSTGGHSRLIENISEFEKGNGSTNVLVITDQVESNLPQRLLSGNLFSEIVCLGNLTVSQKISRLRSWIAKSSKIFNSQHPYDIVPSIALNFSNRPFTIYLNHADHAFWVGASFSDCILNIRPFAKKLTLSRRNAIPLSIVLPVRLNLRKNYQSKEQAKASLSLDVTQKVFLTISRLDKIYPDRYYDMFSVIDDILIRHPDIIYYFVGITAKEYLSITQRQPPPQLILLGIVENPLIYQCAADIYLEGMPINSLTALVESIYAGAFPILMWGPKHPNVNMESEFYIQHVVKHPENKESYLVQIDQAMSESFVNDRHQRVEAMKAYMQYYNSTYYWNEILIDVEQASTPTDQKTAVEYSIQDTDLSLSELAQAFWHFKRSSAYFETLRLLVKYLTIPELVTLWNQFVLSDKTLSIKVKLMSLISLAYNRIRKRKLI